MKFLTNLDLAKNQILNVALQNLGIAPASPVPGQVYYNTTDQNVYYYDGLAAAWVSVAGDISSVVAGNGLIGGGTTGAVTLDVNVDSTTIEIVGDVVRIKDLGVSTAKIADAAVTTAKILDLNVTTSKIADLAVTTAKLADTAVTTVKVTNSAITFAKIQNIATMTVLGNVTGAGTVAAEVAIINSDTMTGATATNLATAASIKAYVDASIVALGNLEGAYAPAIANAALPVAAGGTKKGDYWYVTAAGTVGTAGIKVAVGDVLIANINAASTTLVADWIFLEANRDLATESVIGLVQLATALQVQDGIEASNVVTPATLSLRTATEIRTGLAEIATQVEVDGGLDDFRFITPLKLRASTSTELRPGVAELATSAEAITGTDDLRIVTPLKLKAVLDARVGGYSVSIGTGLATSFSIAHGLASIDIIIELIEAATGATVYADVARTSGSIVTVSFAIAPALNQYYIIIKK